MSYEGGVIEMGCEKCDRTICARERESVSVGTFSRAREGEGPRTHLHVQRARDGKADDEVQEPEALARNPAEDAAAEPGPERRDAGELEEAQLEERRLARRPARQEEAVRQGEQVEARKAHDDVVELVPARATRGTSGSALESAVRSRKGGNRDALVRQELLGERVKGEEAVVVGRAQAVEEPSRDGEERQVLDVRVVLGRVRDNCGRAQYKSQFTSSCATSRPREREGERGGRTVVNVVIVAPPADAEAAHEVGDRDSPQAVGPPVARERRVARVVRDERDLVPERAEETGGEDPVPRAAGRLRAAVRPHREGGEGRVEDERGRVAREEGGRGVEAERVDAGVELLVRPATRAGSTP